MKINKFNFIFMILSMILILVGCSPSKNSGSFEGIGTGKHGEIKVTVSIKDAKITKIDITKQSENKVLADKVYKELSNNIISKNSADIDVVSGATATSEGYLEAVKDALKKSGINLTSVTSKTKDSEQIPTEQTFDVVVVGSGGAGFKRSKQENQLLSLKNFLQLEVILLFQEEK